MIFIIWVLIEVYATSEYDAVDIALLYLQIVGLVASFPLRCEENH